MKLLRNNTNIIINESKARLEGLKKSRVELQRWLDKCPEGKIHVVNSGNRTQFYLRTDPKDKSGRYLPKSDEKTIRNYLQKDYNKKAINIMDEEIKALEKILKYYKQNPQVLMELYSKQPQRVKAQLNPVEISDEEYRKIWESEVFEGKPIGDCRTTQTTDKNEIVRSKTELNIANALYKRGIPYRYEAPLKLKNGHIIHPDFTVLDVAKRKEVYWEHRGMMDDRDYARNSVIRIKALEKEGIFLGDKLIITEETSYSPLRTDDINRVIDFYFQ